MPEEKQRVKVKYVQFEKSSPTSWEIQGKQGLIIGHIYKEGDQTKYGASFSSILNWRAQELQEVVDFVNELNEEPRKKLERELFEHLLYDSPINKSVVEACVEQAVRDVQERLTRESIDNSKGCEEKGF